MHAAAATLVCVRGSPTPSESAAPACSPIIVVPLGPAAVRAHGTVATPVATISVGPSARPSSPTSGTLRTPTAKPTTPTATMSGGIASPLRCSNCHATSTDGSSMIDEHSLAKAMRRQAVRNLDPTPGTLSAQSFLSFSDTRINNSLNNVGVFMGKNDKEIKLSVGALKHMEIDRLKVSPKCNNALPNPETEDDDEADAKYNGPLVSHLVGDITEVGLDDARPGSMFCDFTASLRKSKSQSSKKKQKPPKKAKISTPIRVST